MIVAWLGAGHGRVMRRLIRMLLCTACTVFAASAMTPAAIASTLHDGEALLLQADSPNVHLSVRGQVSIAGRAPLPLSSLPVGEYTLLAEGPGIPLVRGRFLWSPEGVSRRAWAGPASILLPPGYAHLERGDSRGWALAGAAVGSGTMMMVSHSRVGNSQDRMSQAELEYANAVHEEGIEDARRSLQSASLELNDRREIRTLWMAYLATAWLGTALEAIVLTPQPSYRMSESGESYIAELPRAGAWQSVVRSVLVPGGGQRYMGRTSRSNFFLTSTAALAGASIVSHDSFLKARREQADAQRRFDEAVNEQELDQARRALEKAAGRADDRNTVRWILVGATSGMYAWNIIDALGLGLSAGIPGVSWAVTPSEDGVLLGATWSMP